MNVLLIGGPPPENFGLYDVKSYNFRQNNNGNALSRKPVIVSWIYMMVWDKGWPFHALFALGSDYVFFKHLNIYSMYIAGEQSEPEKMIKIR